MQRLPLRSLLLMLSATAVLRIDVSLADDIVFDIDSLHSSITSSANIEAAGISSVPQDEGADFASYFGSVAVRIDDLLNPSSIEFLSAELGAESSGAWLPDFGGGLPGEPGSPQLAEFGFLFNAPDGFAVIAVRDSVITMTSEPIPVDEDGMFSSLQEIETTAGSYDVNIASSRLGGPIVTSIDLGEDPGIASNAAERGSIISGDDGVTTLTMPMDLTFSSDGIDTIYKGVFVGTFGEPMIMRLPGDANEDGRVDATDLNAVGLNWQTDNNTWATGDFTNDGRVDAADLNVLGVHWQESVGVPAAVPEPSSLLGVLVALVGGGCLRRPWS